MILRVILLLLLLLPLKLLNAQEKKAVEALRIKKPLTLDGVLDEEAYLKAQPATDFVQFMPHNGKPAMQPSSVYLFYDENSFYLGALHGDSAPDSIFNYISERDHIGMSDYFGIYIDPYNQGQLAFGFFITASGTQVDLKAIRKEHDEEDPGWDAVWYSKTKITEEGWTVEMRIPYSELRMPSKDVQTWGINMFRNVRRHHSNASWNFVDRKIDGFIHQQGELTGIENIDPPLRLSLTPYAAGYYQTGEGRANSDFLYKGGLDLKYGISESYTLDMMLIPDFGQVQSDDQELNLSPYELYYDERRQFFNEGTELFQRAELFYSRRIGASPVLSEKAEKESGENEEIDFMPTETRLVNATKVSGRNRNGLGMGILNAMSLSSYASLKDTLSGDTRDVLVQPFTNYNVLVVDQSMRNNSYLSLINTNISMAGSPFSANVTGTDFEFRDKTKTLKVSGKAALSIRGETKKEKGYYSRLGIEKNVGNAGFGVSQRVYSDKYNPNDLGYLRRNNYLTTRAFASYQIIEPFSVFREIEGEVWLEYNRMYEPSVFASNLVGFELFSHFRNNYIFAIAAGHSGQEYDYYEPRVDGRYFTRPEHNVLMFFFRSDYRKRLSFLAEYEGVYYSEGGWRDHELYTEATLRLGRRFELEYGILIEKGINDHGYIDKCESEDSIYFANREINTLSNIIEASFIINKDMAIHLRTRHYWSSARNETVFLLDNEGVLNEYPAYSENQDMNYNAFTLDMDFRWIFAPGSEMIFAVKSSVFCEHDSVIPGYWDNLGTTRRGDPLNSVSLKVLYYLDWKRVFG